MKKNIEPEGQRDMANLWDIDQVANYFGLNEKTIRRLIERGSFPGGRRIGRSRRWDPEEIKSFGSEKPEPLF